MALVARVRPSVRERGHKARSVSARPKRAGFAALERTEDRAGKRGRGRLTREPGTTGDAGGPRGKPGGAEGNSGAGGDDDLKLTGRGERRAQGLTLERGRENSSSTRQAVVMKQHRMPVPEVGRNVLGK